MKNRSVSETNLKQVWGGYKLECMICGRDETEVRIYEYDTWLLCKDCIKKYKEWL